MTISKRQADILLLGALGMASGFAAWVLLRLADLAGLNSELGPHVSETVIVTPLRDRLRMVA